MCKQISDYLPEVKDYYFINENGDLYSSYSNKILTDHIDKKTGYVTVGLQNNNGKRKWYLKHRIMMKCFNFIEDCEEMQVNHIDGNKINNNINNLEWCTASENSQHAKNTGLQIIGKGNKSPYHKLTENDVKEIIEMLLSKKYTQQEIADKYKVSRTSISMIKNKKRWIWLTKDIDFK